MQPVGSEHLSARLVPHECEEIIPRRAGAFGLVARDRIELFDRTSQDDRIAEAGPRRRQRPVGLRQGDHACVGCVALDPLMDRANLVAITLLAISTDDVVRADEQGYERWPERRDEGQLFGDEVVRGVSVHRWVRENDLSPTAGPDARQDRGKRAIGRRAGANGERVTEREESFWNGQLF